MTENPIRTNIEVTKRKPLVRRAREYLLSRKFELSDNPSVALLEENLGINFPFIPKRIVVTGKNIAPHQKRYKGFNDDLDEAFGGTLGHYQHDIDGFFVPENSSLFIELHENMHGFIGYINPDFTKKRISPLEKELTYQFVDEGLCEWAATTVSNKLIEKREILGQDISDLIDRRHTNATAEQNNTRNMFPDAPTEGIKRSLIHGLHELQTTVVQNSESQFEWEWTRKDVGRKSYTVGFYFVTTVMNSLVASGMSINDALITLISNPPTSFDAIFAPEDFALSLISAKK